MTLLTGTLVAIVALQLLVGLAVARRTATKDDLLLAGRRMGPLLATGTLFATWFGAETCLSAAGAAYADGVSLASAEPFAYGMCIITLGLVFARRLQRLGLTTLADFFRTRYSPSVERVAALLMIPTSLLWAAAQVHALGLLLSTTIQVPFQVGVLGAAGVAVAYTAVGGLLADAITDLVQGAILVLGLVIMACITVSAAGGWGAAWHSVSGAGLSLLPASMGGVELLETWSVPLLGSLLAQELVSRVSACRSARTASTAAVVAGVTYIVVGTVPLFLGLLARHLGVQPHDAEAVIPELARTHLPPMGQALLLAALVSAILSTVDSTLLVTASLAFQNLLPRARVGAAPRRELRSARLLLAAAGACAAALALAFDDIASLVSAASALGSAGILVIGGFGIFSRIGGAVSAHAALGCGLSTWVGASLAGARAPFVLSVLAAIAGYLAGCVHRPRPIPASGSP